MTRSLARWLATALLAALLAPLPAQAQALHCVAEDRMTVVRATDVDAFAFYPWRRQGDLYFQLPGRDIRPDPGTPPGKHLFTLDGIHFEFLLTPKAPFATGTGPFGDDVILKRHAADEHRVAASRGTPLARFEDQGNRTRPASEGVPPLTFKMWIQNNPLQPLGPRQYYVTTVIGDDVAALVAIVPREALKAQALALFKAYTESFQPITDAAFCPKARATAAPGSAPASAAAP